MQLVAGRSSHYVALCTRCQPVSFTDMRLTGFLLGGDKGAKIPIPTAFRSSALGSAHSGSSEDRNAPLPTQAQNLEVTPTTSHNAMAARAMWMNKSDRSDARGLAEILRMSWYREAGDKRMESRQVHGAKRDRE